ncbi:hypothetical protein MKW98_018719 [Papaver atlanticum]|uniref:Cyclin N-terminal domain-containing protein n=1 Tax=Papaver atlanticum TaxID=357466 RepID=A0AAD4T597_9MAGN|nr:hypothetical protein MKW98_018719 [Papaver atlanticum]
MVRSDENSVPGVIGPINNNAQGLQRGVIGKKVSETGHNRTALSTINRNIIGGPPYQQASKKPALSENNGICHNNPPHRPITRKFAAQLKTTNNQLPPTYPQVKPEQTIKQVPFVVLEDPDDDCTIIDVDEYKSCDENFVPMYVKHTEAMLDEIDQMDDEEVEMEDIAEEEVMDIDSSDKKNPLAVVEYIEDIFAHHRNTESSSCVSPCYMAQQFDINEKMRGILIDWLIEVHYKFELMDETLYLTVNLIDRFLERKTVLRKKLQLVGVTAMLLACKYEEVSVPVVEDLILISDKAYTRKEVLDMEKSMVNTLQFNMSVPTPYTFMRRFLKAAQPDKKLELLSFFMIELCLVEYEMLKYSPSLLAASAIYTAQCTISRSKHWTKTSEWHTKYCEDELKECSRLMVTFHQKAGSGKVTGVHRKYSTYKFGCAAKSEPALFLLETEL